MSIHVDVHELRELATDFGFAAVILEHDVTDSFERAAYSIQSRAQVLAPVDTGALRNSIGSETHGLHTSVDADVSYADYVERGTSRMAPQPFMGPAFDSSLGGILEDIADQAIDAIANL